MKTVPTRRRSESAYIRQVHDNVIMYTSTRLHKHLPMYLRNDNDVIDNDGCGVTGVSGKIHLNGERVLTSSESQERVVSNDILSERKYSQLFTHESNIFLLKQLSGK